MSRWGSVAALLALTGCGLFQDAPVDSPMTNVAALPASALAHPRTSTWVRRFCAKKRTSPVSSLSTPQTREKLPVVQAVLAAHGLPQELVAVPAVESRFHALARGSAGELGRRFGLAVGGTRDERAHVEHATRAAAQYLQFLHDRYDDWPLAIAAYNAGEGRVDRALARRPQATFWELASRGALPAISRDYVPKVFAVVRIASRPNGCG
jgi:hypothetical protein